jgi:hypothetical protein
MAFLLVIIDDLHKNSNPGCSYVGCLKGFAELCSVVQGILASPVLREGTASFFFLASHARVEAAF